MKKALGLLAVAALSLNIAACSTADEGGGGNTIPTVDGSPLTLSPSTVSVGATSTLTWKVKDAEKCTASGDPGSNNVSAGKWKGDQPVSGSVVVGPYSTPGSYTYVLTCTSSTGSVLSQTATLNVGAAATIGVSLMSSSNEAKPNETIRLTWTTSGNPVACTASSNKAVDGWSGNMPTMSSASGIWVKLPTEGSYIFTLMCSDTEGRQVRSDVPVSVGTKTSAKPLLMISSNPASVTQGTSSLIKWTTANATSCVANSSQTIDGWHGSDRPVNDVSNGMPASFATGSTLVPGSYSYGLVCNGPGGNVSQDTQLTVTDANGGTSSVPTLTFKVSNSSTLTGNNSTTVKVGDVAYLSWVSTNATNCVATGGMWAPSSQPTSQNNLAQGPFNSPGIYDFALTCQDASGNSVAQVVEVKVTSNGPSVSFSAQPSPATQGSPVTLVWTASSDATSCTGVTGPTQDTTWIGPKPISGSYAVPASVYNTPSTYEYVLRCTGPTGTTTVPVSFTVNPSNPGGPQFTNAFTATPISLPAAGGTTKLTWTTTNATGCTASSNPPVSGWSGNQATSSAADGVSVVLPANAGTAPVSYTLELTCSNGSGSMRQSQVVTVQGTVPQPTATLKANPETVVAGPNARTTLTYNTSNVVTCKTDGGGATGIWDKQPVPNAGPTSVEGTEVSKPMTVAGSYTYTLICEGPNGTTPTASVTVIATSPAAPSFTPVKGQLPGGAGLFVTATSGSTTPATKVAPGSDLYFSWASEGATSCTPSSNEPVTPASSWASAKTGLSGTDEATKASNVPGYYSYTITCTGPTNPPAISTVNVLVVSPTASYCPQTPTAGGLSTNSMALTTDTTAPSYAATTPSATGSSVCVGCSVGAAPNVVGNVTNPSIAPAPENFPFGFTDYASMILPVGALTANAEEINIRNTSPTPVIYPAGRTVNVGLVVPDTLLLASVLGNVSISTTLNGVAQEATPPGLLNLQVLGLLGSGSGYVTLPTTKPFDGVRVNFGGTVTALSTLQVHMACVSLVQ